MSPAVAALRAGQTLPSGSQACSQLINRFRMTPLPSIGLEKGNEQTQPQAAGGIKSAGMVEHLKRDTDLDPLWSRDEFSLNPTLTLVANSSRRSRGRLEGREP